MPTADAQGGDDVDGPALPRTASKPAARRVGAGGLTSRYSLVWGQPDELAAPRIRRRHASARRMMGFVAVCYRLGLPKRGTADGQDQSVPAALRAWRMRALAWLDTDRGPPDPTKYAALLTRFEWRTGQAAAAVSRRSRRALPRGDTAPGRRQLRRGPEEDPKRESTAGSDARRRTGDPAARGPVSKAAARGVPGIDQRPLRRLPVRRGRRGVKTAGLRGHRAAGQVG